MVLISIKGPSLLSCRLARPYFEGSRCLKSRQHALRFRRLPTSSNKTSKSEAKDLGAGRLAQWPNQFKFLSFTGGKEKVATTLTAKGSDCLLNTFRPDFQKLVGQNGFFHTVCSQCSSSTLLLLPHCSVCKVYITFKVACENRLSHKTAAWLLSQNFLKHVILAINPGLASQMSTHFYKIEFFLFVSLLKTDRQKHVDIRTNRRWNRRQDVIQ